MDSAVGGNCRWYPELGYLKKPYRQGYPHLGIEAVESAPNQGAENMTQGSLPAQHTKQA
jgi:hypothetical protein